MEEYIYTTVFEAAEAGGYVVSLPAIPGLATQGETLDEARAMPPDCLQAYLESLRIDGEVLSRAVCRMGRGFAKPITSQPND